MIGCSLPVTPPVLVAASAERDVGLARAAIEELELVPVLVQGTAEAVRLLCHSPTRFAALVAGERMGETSGFTLCGVARDAGCRLPILLLTSDDCRWTAVRAARLEVSVLWQPVPTLRVAQTLRAMLPRSRCGAAGSVKLPAWPHGVAGTEPEAGGVVVTAARGQVDGWRRSRW